VEKGGTVWDKRVEEEKCKVKKGKESKNETKNSGEKGKWKKRGN
jgi:hypothetical protein